MRDRTQHIGALSLMVTIGLATSGAASVPATGSRLGADSAQASSRIAFISAPCFHPSCSGALYVMNPDGSGQRVVRRDVWWGVAWSHDGRRIVFNRDSGIYVVNADATGERRLTRTRWGAAVAWSPGGRKLAFTRFTRKITKTPSRRRISKINEVHVMNADGSGLRRLTSGRSDQLLGWLPDGRIAFVRHTRSRAPSRSRNSPWTDTSELYVMNANGSGKRNLTREWGLDGQLGPNYFWSPDGRKIAFTSGLGLYVMNADGSGQRRLTRSPANGGAIAWSPDARKIAFVRDRNHNSPGYQSEIYVINADGSGQRRLTQRGASPRWSPDGEKIAFRSSRDGNRELYVMNADGSEERRLTQMAQNGAWVHDVAWSPEPTR